MYFFIDESGDRGFKFEKGSSEYFCVAAVVFESGSDIEIASKAILNLEQKLSIKNFPNIYEWHFNKTPYPRQKAFFETIINLPFEIIFIAMHKPSLQDEHLKRNSNLFYHEMLKILFSTASDKLDNSKIILDKCGDKEFYREAKKYIRNNGFDKTMIRKLEGKDSHESKPLQLADMVVSAMAKHLKSPSDKSEYLYRMIKGKICKIKMIET